MIKQVATFVTGSTKAGVTSTEIEEARYLLVKIGADLTGIKWLRPDVAFEIYFKAPEPACNRQIFAPLAEKFDIAVQPDRKRLKKLLLADMDSTMISMESLDCLADALGFGAEVEAITARGMRGEIDFDQSLRARVALLKNQSAGALAHVIEQIAYNPGASILVQTLKAHGCYTTLVSGGFTFTTQAVASHLGFDEHHANRLEIENNKLTGKVTEPICGPTAKLDNLKRLCKKLTLQPDDVCTIGDGANDIPMIKAAGLGIAYRGKPVVRQSTPFQINHSDLTSLLYFQGIAYDDFVMDASSA